MQKNTKKEEIYANLQYMYTVADKKNCITFQKVENSAKIVFYVYVWYMMLLQKNKVAGFM